MESLGRNVVLGLVRFVYLRLNSFDEPFLVGNGEAHVRLPVHAEVVS